MDLNHFNKFNDLQWNSDIQYIGPYDVFLSFDLKLTSNFLIDAQDMVNCHVNATSQRILPTHVARNQNVSSTLMWPNSPTLPLPKLPSLDPPMPLPLSHLECQIPTHSQLLPSPKASSLAFLYKISFTLL